MPVAVTVPLPEPDLLIVRSKLAVTPVPRTVLFAPPPPVKEAVLVEVTAEVGLKRTVTVWLSPAAMS